MQNEILVSVKNFSRDYGQFCAVDDISFELRRGQILGFLGPNGAGKSTTMQVIAGTLAPTEGEITIAGHDLIESPLKAKAALGYLPENPPLYQEMLVEEYLTFCGYLHRIPRPQLTHAVDRVLEQCSLGEVRHRLIANLSKGYQQRVGIAQAIIHTPSVVILDEPTIGLDPIQIQEIRELIRQLGQEHSVIVSTHILSEVQMICNHVQIIHEGKLVLNTTIDGLYEQMQSTRLHVGLRQPPELNKLKQLLGSEDIIAVDEKHFTIQHEPNHSPAELLVEKSVAHQWGLFELTPEKPTLEQIFVDMTRGE